MTEGAKIIITNVTLQGPRTISGDLNLWRYSPFCAHVNLTGTVADMVSVPTSWAFFIGIFKNSTISSSYTHAFAFVTRSDNVAAQVILEDGTYTWLSSRGQNQDLAFTLSGSLSAQQFDQPSISSDPLPVPPSTCSRKKSVGKQKRTAAVGAPSHIATVAFDLSADFVNAFGTDAELVDYIGRLVTASNAVYANELGMIWCIARAHGWDSNQSYVRGESTNSRIGRLKTRWSTPEFPGSQYSIVSHLSNERGGGLAYIGGICGTQYNFAVSFDMSNLFDGEFIKPWDMVVTSHEHAHLMRAGHTHAYSPQVDGCYKEGCNNPGEGCSGSLPPSCPGVGKHCGTIMSYCHGLTGGMDNIFITFGTSLITTNWTLSYANNPLRILNDMDTSMLQCTIARNAKRSNGELRVPTCFRLTDFNHDGKVDLSDVATSILAFGPCGTSCPADLNGDGKVDLSDLATVLLALDPTK